MSECPSAGWDRHFDAEERAAESQAMQRTDDLARALWGFYIGWTGASWERISRAVFDGTPSGVSVYHDPKIPGQVDVHGYCEGVGDAVCPSYILSWPYTHADIVDAVKRANEDAIQMWNDTHGCEDCGISPDEFGDRAVNPDCKTCHGKGAIR